MLKTTNVLLNYASYASPASVALAFLGEATTVISGGSSPSTVTLPDATTCELGVKYEVINNSTGIVSVASFDTSTVLAIEAGLSAVFTCVSVSVNTPAAWFAEYGTAQVDGNCIVSVDGSSKVCATDGGFVDVDGSMTIVGNTVNDSSALAVIGNVSITGNLDMQCQSVGNVLSLSVANVFGKKVMAPAPSVNGTVVVGGDLSVIGNLTLSSVPALVTPNNYHASLKNIPVGGIYRSFFDDGIVPESFPITSSFVSAGTTLTVTVTGNVIEPGMFLSGGGVTSGTQIVSQLTGTMGDVGTYQVDNSQAMGVAPTALIFQSSSFPDVLYIRTV